MTLQIETDAWRRRGRAVVAGNVNVRIGFLSVALLLAALGADAALTARPSGLALDAEPEAILWGNALHVSLPMEAAASLDPSLLRLVVNEGPPQAPLLVEDFLAANGTLRLVFLEGGGSGDDARLVLDGESGTRNVTVEVATAPDVLPGPRWGATLVADGAGVAYAFGGAVTPAALLGETTGEWVALDSVLRIDLTTGDVSTRAARLPTGRVVASGVWDPRPSDACPAGCAYVLGGMETSAKPVNSILRYDPVADAVTELPVTLPSPRFDATAVWSGTHAYLVGGGWNVLRFDPQAGRVDSLPASPFAYAFGAGAVFDPRPSSACPSGCAYVFGGREALDPAPPLSTALTERDAILRLDVSTGALAPLPARLPLRLEAFGVAWDGERAFVLGGRACSPEACVRSDAIFSFDPATLAVAALGRLPMPLENAPAVWHEGDAILVSGKADGAPGGSLDRLVRVRPEGRA